MPTVLEKSHARFAAESQLGLTRRARRIDRALAQTYPDARAELDFTSAFELLIATVLSAQTTDVRVNEVTPVLFAAYPDALALSEARVEDVESIVRPTGFFRMKAKNIVALAAQLVERHGGKVPAATAELIALPGVGVKTARVVLGNAFDVPGLAVDTHVMRLSHRLGYSQAKDPLTIEAEVSALFPARALTMVSHRLIFHGRRICHAKKPACGVCPIAALCPSFGTGELDPVKAEKLLGYSMTLPTTGEHTQNSSAGDAL